jgi:hypothetical protein
VRARRDHLLEPFLQLAKVGGPGDPTLKPSINLERGLVQEKSEDLAFVREEFNCYSILLFKIK